jgi:Protein of unknown function (DUF3604)
VGATAHWKDPDFDASERAFYYARVIEIPTPRWTADDPKRFGVKMDDNVPMITPGGGVQLADLVHAGGVKGIREKPMRRFGGRSEVGGGR